MVHRPVNGQPVSDLNLGASFQSSQIRMLSDYQANQLGPQRHRTGGGLQIECVNTVNRVIEFGTVLRVKGPQVPSGAGGSIPGDLFKYNPRVVAGDPVWHTGIDNLIPVTETLAAASALGKADGGTWQGLDKHVAILKVRVGLSDNDRFLMLDPSGGFSTSDGNKVMVTSDAGIWKIIALDLQSTSDGGLFIALVDMRISQPLWRYELLEDSFAPETTRAKLLRLDGDVFADEILLSDPLSLMDDQLLGDVGYCINTGNEFYAINAPCGHADLLPSSLSSAPV